MFVPVEQLRSVEGDGVWRLAVRGRRARTYALQASLRTLARPFTPCAVSWQGRPLPGWTHDPDAGVLRVTFTGRRGDLVVRACR